MDGGCGRGTERVELTGSAVLSLRVGHFRGLLPVCSACTTRGPASSVIYVCSTTSTTSTPRLRCPVTVVVRHPRLLDYLDYVDAAPTLSGGLCRPSSTSAHLQPRLHLVVDLLLGTDNSDCTGRYYYGDRTSTCSTTGLCLPTKKRSTWPEALAKFSADRGLSRCRRRPTSTDFDSCAPGQPGVVPPCGSAVQIFRRPKT